MAEIYLGGLPRGNAWAHIPRPRCFRGLSPRRSDEKNALEPLEPAIFICPRIAYKIINYLHHCKCERNKINIWLRSRL